MAAKLVPSMVSIPTISLYVSLIRLAVSTLMNQVVNLANKQIRPYNIIKSTLLPLL